MQVTIGSLLHANYGLSRLPVANVGFYTMERLFFFSRELSTWIDLSTPCSGVSTTALGRGGNGTNEREHPQ